MKILKALLILLTVSALPCFAQAQLELKSPDGNLTFNFRLTPEAPVYSLRYKGHLLVGDSRLGLALQHTSDLGPGLKMLKIKRNKINENYELLVGKTSKVLNRHNELIIPMTESAGDKRQLTLRIKAFNDGLAFRYEFPEQKQLNALVITEEKSEFNIQGDPKVTTLFWGDYNNSHEGLYHKLAYSQIKPDTLMDMPALLEYPGKVYMAITEASLRNYAGMYLVKNNGRLKSHLSPLQGQKEVKVKAALPHQSPWRVMLVSDRPGALIESNLLSSLNEPPKDMDWSWLKPGKTSFHWWNGDVTPDNSFAPGVNFETNKYYIDFCAANNIEYHSVIGYGGFAWYKSNAAGYATVGPETDVTTPVPSLNMQRVCDYAKSKGVDIHVWVHWRAIYPNLEKAFAQFQKWGVKGMMVDFMERDDQEMVNIQEEILQKAAAHKLFIQFHGAFKPTGLHRTYPNEFTREGTLNYEVNKWSKTGIPADHDIDMPFTRLLAGAADYHLGGFRAVHPQNFKRQYVRPLQLSTRTHMMAMYVVMESYLNMVADYPQAYHAQPGFEFLRQVPTVWDETVVPKAEVGKYVTIARRKGQDWYIGTINNSEARTITVPLDFLDGSAYTADIYEDTEASEKSPNVLNKRSQEVSRKDQITIQMAAGGGHVMRIRKK